MKVAIIGGGSYLWSPGFCRQFIRSQRLKDIELALMDRDAQALELVAETVEIMRNQEDSPLRLAKTLDMDAALDAADYVLVSISTGGLEAMRHDVEIPQKYGIWHTVGDTVGPGGWSRAVRNIPVFHEIASRISRLCPSAWMINVSNPLTPLTRVPTRCFGVKAIGMCPGVDSQARRLAALAGCNGHAEPEYVVTGIDHGSWFTDLRANGTDILAKLKELGYCRSDGRLPTEVRTADPLAGAAQTRAAFAVWSEVGFLPSISDRHIVENFPWFLARPSDDLPLQIKRTSIADRLARREAMTQLLREFVRTRGESGLGELGHGDDPVVNVVEALEGHNPFVCGANYMNAGQAPGFPEGAVMESRCRFDRNGVHPFPSPMPDILKTFTLPTVLRQEAVIDIALTGSFDDLVALVYSDPLCCRLLPGECRAMTREMLEANRAWIRNSKLLRF